MLLDPSARGGIFQRPFLAFEPGGRDAEMTGQQIQGRPADAGRVAIFPTHDGGFVHTDQRGDLLERLARGETAFVQTAGGQKGCRFFPWSGSFIRGFGKSLLYLLYHRLQKTQGQITKKLQST